MSKKEIKTLKGVSVHHYKNTEDYVTEIMPEPDRVYLPCIQHMGVPCTPVVKVGELVKVGQLVADCDKPFSSPIYSSVSGKVVALEDFINPMGARTTSIVIESDHLQEMHESIAPPVVTNTEEFIKAVRASGLVGLGGAGFPTHIKLSLREPAKVDTLCINIAECEPYITSDYRNVMEDSQDIIDGIELVKKYVGNISKVYIGVEDNKPKAIQRLQLMCQDKPYITVLPMRSQYPKGAEKVLIYEATGKVVGDGMIPADVGVVVMNGTSIAFLAQYIKTGIPLISKRITVDGSAITTPKNIRVPLGTRFIDIINFCGGYKQEPRKMLMGGPMMGIAIYDENYPLLKNNNALLCFGEEETKAAPETACIRCGRCVRACPFSLMPAAIDKAYQAKDVEKLKALYVGRCMECGCCSYVCPAKRNLVMTNRLAKGMLRAASAPKK